MRGQSDRGLSEWEYVSKRILHHERGTFTESGRRGAGMSLRPLLTYRAAAGHSVGLVRRGPQGRRDHASLTRISAGPSWHGAWHGRLRDREPSGPPRQSMVSKMARHRSLRAWRGRPRGEEAARACAAPRDLGREEGGSRLRRVASPRGKSPARGVAPPRASATVNSGRAPGAHGCRGGASKVVESQLARPSVQIFMQP